MGKQKGMKGKDEGLFERKDNFNLFYERRMVWGNDGGKEWNCFLIRFCFIHLVIFLAH